MRHLIFLIVMLLPAFIQAQCLQGDCKNGEGKMDYGYAVYEGSFKNGEPNGTGIMDYGSGDKYVGTFINGKEHGTGLVFKKGIAKPATYINGILQVKKEQIVIGAPKMEEKIPGCISGDCANGYGVMSFPSGNRYEGNFYNYQFSGRGKMIFAGGNILEADFKEHKPQSGTMYYKQEQTVFTGTFNSDGTPASGNYKAIESGSLVTVNNGNIISVKNPRMDSIRASRPKLVSKTCPVCFGKGFEKTTKTKSISVGGIGRVSSLGYVTWDYEPTSISSTHSSYKNCATCNGTGKVVR